MDVSIALKLAFLSMLCKVLLMPSYHSTDLEVHRNWLAITHSTPMNQWYLNQSSSSPWTLDYPPFFAYLERVLAYFAHMVDSRITDTTNIDFDDIICIFFQRGTVILTDLLLNLAVFLLLGISSPNTSSSTSLLVFALVTFHPALLIIDHIHFQYNGLLLGVLILAIYYSRSNQFILSAVAFSSLVMLKHLFLPLALPFAVYLITRYCQLDLANLTTFRILRLFQLMAVAACILMLAFGPFCIFGDPHEQMRAILSRLFPFHRGLLHAYWAPNVWAIYAFIDYIALLVHRLIGYDSNVPRYISGIIGEITFHFLPQITPLISTTLVALAITPCLIRLYRTPSYATLLHGCIHTSLSAFMLGYHVHEKAILPPLFLATISSSFSNAHGTLMIFMTGPSLLSLFPLLTRATEIGTKVLMSVTYIALLWTCFSHCISTRLKRFVYTIFHFLIVRAI